MSVRTDPTTTACGAHATGPAGAASTTVRDLSPLEPVRIRSIDAVCHLDDDLEISKRCSAEFDPLRREVGHVCTELNFSAPAEANLNHESSIARARVAGFMLDGARVPHH